jgi:cytochrome c
MSPLIAAALLAAALPGRPIPPQGDGEPPANQPPRVTIQTPEDGARFDWETLVPYAIRVSDPEDGDSAYDEIPRNEVFLEVTWLPGASAQEARALSERPDPPGLASMKRSSCFNCHAVNTRVLGPPFSEIAERYRADAATVDLLARRVRDGSSGVWGEMPMLPHPDLASDELSQMVRWVLDCAADPGRSHYAGTEGAFRTLPDPGDAARGAYVLSASYTDRGTGEAEAGRARGRHTIVLLSR